MKCVVTRRPKHIDGQADTVDHVKTVGTFYPRVMIHSAVEKGKAMLSVSAGILSEKA